MRGFKIVASVATVFAWSWIHCAGIQARPQKTDPPKAKSNQQARDETKAPEDIFAVVSDGHATTATKTERLVKLSPSALTVITRKQIEEADAHSLAEVLRLVPGMNYRMTPMGNFYGIRSFGSYPFSTRILLLIDGFPFNSPDKGGE